MAAIVAMVTTQVLEPRLGARAFWAGLAAGAFVVAPVVAALAAAAGALLWVTRRRATAHREARQADAEVGLLAELTGLGLTAGLALPAALEVAAANTGELLRREVSTVLRRARTLGTAVALSEAEGRGRDLYRLVARAIVTGAPLRPAVAAFADQARSEERARRLAAARRLPVRLLIPLSLLILPGFVLLSLGPALLGGLERLDLTLPPASGRPPY